MKPSCRSSTFRKPLLAMTSKLMISITGVLCAGSALYLIVSESSGSPNGPSPLSAGKNPGGLPATTAADVTVSTNRNPGKRPERGASQSSYPAKVGTSNPRRRTSDKGRGYVNIAEMSSNSDRPELGSAPADESAGTASIPAKSAMSNPHPPDLDGWITASRRKISGPVPLAVRLASIRPEALRPEERRLIEGADSSFRNSVEEEARLSEENAEAGARYRSQAVNLHDEYLRMTLGWDRFNQLSAEAARKWRSNQVDAPRSVSESLNH